MKTNSIHNQTNRETTIDTLKTIALTIFGMLGDHQAAAVKIGGQVEKAILGASPQVANIRVRKLATVLEFPIRELVRCHQAYFVSTLAGQALAMRLPLGAPLDLYVQFFRIARADGSLEWKRDSILKIAEKVGHGLPVHEASGLVDAALAGHLGRRRSISASQWCRKPDVGVAMAVEAATRT